MNEPFNARIIFNNEDVIEATLLVTKAGENLYRIEETPFLMETVGFGDVIKADIHSDDSLLFRHIVEKSKMIELSYFIQEGFAGSPKYEALADRIVEAGGTMERIAGGCLFIHLPSDSDLELEIDRIITGKTRKK